MDSDEEPPQQNKLLNLFNFFRRSSKSPVTNSYPLEERDIAKFFDTPISLFSVPRSNVVFIDGDMTLREASALIYDKGFSRFPVRKSKKDEVIGIFHSKDVFGRIGEIESLKVKDIMRQPFFVPHHFKTYEVLEFLRNENTHFAIILDEYGGVDGIITLENLFEELLGDFRDEFDKEAEPSSQKYEDMVVMDGDYPLDNFNEDFGTTFLKDGVETIGGYIIYRMGKIPETGEVFETDSLVFEIIEGDTMKIEKIRITKVSNK